MPTPFSQHSASTGGEQETWPPADQTFQRVHRDAQLLFATDLDGHGFAVAVQVRTLSHHVERVEQFAHSRSVRRFPLQLAQLQGLPARGDLHAVRAVRQAHVNQ